MKVVLSVAALAACAGDSDIQSQLDAMPAVSLSHADDAARIVEIALAMPANAAAVRWVTGVMPRAPGGEAVNGVAIGCDLWVLWWGDGWTSGASADGPAISFTAFAHEMAHCALWLRGEDDPRHERADWWGIGGRVERATADLVLAGM